MDADAVARRLTFELMQHWERQPKAAQGLLCERGEDSAWVQVQAPPLKKRWLTSTDLALLVAEPPDAATSPTWRAAVDTLRARGWAGDSYTDPLSRVVPVPDGRTPELARWTVDELVDALQTAYGVTDLDGLHWVLA